MNDIWHEIAQIDDIDNQTILLCIDALNENHRPDLILRQLNELAQSTYPWLKILITCRPEVWNNVRKSREIKLAEALYYRDHRSKQFAVYLDDFTYSQRLDIFSAGELSQVYKKYQTVYHILTHYEMLSESMRNYLRDPLVLSLYAHIYQHSYIPETADVRNVIPEYVQSMLETGRVEQRDINFLMETLMPIMIREGHYTNSISDQDIQKAGKKLFEEIYVGGTLSSGRKVNQSFSNLLDAEILVRKEGLHDFDIAFKFERFYDYFANLQLQNLFLDYQNRRELFYQLLDKLEDYPFLWGAVKNLLIDDIISDQELGKTLTQVNHFFGRDLVRSALVDLGKSKPNIVHKILLAVIDLQQNTFYSKLRSTAKVATNTPENPGHQQVGPPLVDTLVNSDFCGTAKLLLSAKTLFASSKHSELNNHEASKLMTIKIASQLSMWDIFAMGAVDSSANVRVSVVEEVYLLLQQQETQAVFNILEELENQSSLIPFASIMKSIEARVVISLLVIFELFENKNIVTKIRDQMTRIISITSIITQRKGGIIRTKITSLLRNAFIWILVRFAINAVKKVEESQIVIVSFKDLKSSFEQEQSTKKQIGRIMSYVNLDHQLTNAMTSDLNEHANSRDLLTLYAVAVVFYAYFLNEKKKAIELAKSVCHTSLEQDPPSPIVAGVLLAMGSVIGLRPLEFDAEMWYAFEGITNEYFNTSHCTVGSYDSEYFWNPFSLYSYYYDLHIHISKGKSALLADYLMYIEQQERWKELEIFISFLAQINVEYFLCKESVLQLLSFTDHKNPNVRETAIRAIAQLRSRYSTEIDEILRDSDVSTATSILAKNYHTSQNIGMILTVSLAHFWTRGIINGDRDILDYLQWVATHVSESNSVHEWLTGIIRKLFNTILE